MTFVLVVEDEESISDALSYLMRKEGFEVDEGFVEDEAKLGLAAAWAPDPKTTALLHVGVSAAIGSPAVCLEWSAGRALAAGASEDEIADVLLAIAPVAGLGRVVTAVTGVADAFGYDIEAALEDPGDH